MRAAEPARHLAGHRACRVSVEGGARRALRRAERSDVEPLPWFERSRWWKAAVFCEAIYGRYVRGELGAEDTRAARFKDGVPYLADAAAAAISRA